MKFLVGEWYDVRVLEDLQDDRFKGCGVPVGTVIADVFGRQFFRRVRATAQTLDNLQSRHFEWVSDNTSFASIGRHDRVRLCYLPGYEGLCDHTEFVEAQRKLREIQEIVRD